MKSDDEIRLIEFCKGAIEYHLTDTVVLKIAKAARKFREEGEVRSGDEVQIETPAGTWKNAIYIGYAHVKPYHVVKLDGNWVSYHEEVIRPKPKTETRVKGIAALAKALEAGGWKPGRGGDFTKKVGGIGFNSSMWQFCGEVPPNTWNWHPDWLEEVEV